MQYIEKRRMILMAQKEKGRNRHKEKRDFPRNSGSWKGLSGAEYECTIMKCLSLYRGKAGTRVTKEYSATSTLRVWTGHQAKL